MTLGRSPGTSAGAATRRGAGSEDELMLPQAQHLAARQARIPRPLDTTVSAMTVA